MDSEEQEIGAIAILVYLENLVASSPKETFTREEVLMILECVGNDPEIFQPGSLATAKDALCEGLLY